MQSSSCGMSADKHDATPLLAGAGDPLDRTEAFCAILLSASRSLLP
jgi:hypothetical protein